MDAAAGAGLDLLAQPCEACASVDKESLLPPERVAEHLRGDGCSSLNLPWVRRAHRH